MTKTDKIQTQKFTTGSKVYYQGIPDEKATVKIIRMGKAYLKYRGEKGFLVVPLSHCSSL